LLDTSPCDFWFFGFLKARSKGRQKASDQQRLDTAFAFWPEVTETEFCAVYEEWIQ
jgi:hypothetical protein